MPERLSRLLAALFYGFLLCGGAVSYQAHADSVMSGGGSCPRARDLAAETDNSPTVDIAHIFCGAINSRGKPVGYHHRQTGKGATTASIGQITRKNQATGVYMAKGIKVWNGERWLLKKGLSSFFPDSCTAAQVFRSIRFASSHIAYRYRNGKWSGQSAPSHTQTGVQNQYCLGEDESILTIQGYFQKGGRAVATAWPLVAAQKGNCIAENADN